MLQIKFDGKEFEKKALEIAERTPIEVSCPASECSGKIKVSIADARARKTVKCPTCGAVIQLQEAK